MEGNDVFKQTYLCLVEFGHLGMGKSLEGYVCVFADGVYNAMRKARYFPGVKTHRHVLEVEQI